MYRRCVSTEMLKSNEKLKNFPNAFIKTMGTSLPIVLTYLRYKGVIVVGRAVAQAVSRSAEWTQLDSTPHYTN
jgi:hypothetical protein